MSEFKLEDTLLLTLRDARPAFEDDWSSPESAPAQELIERILNGVPSSKSTLSRVTRPLAVGGVAAAMLAAAVIGFNALNHSPEKSSQHRIAPSAHQAITLDARTIAFKASKAVNQASQSGIEYVREVATSADGTVLDSTDLWGYGASHRVEAFGHDNTPIIDNSRGRSGAVGVNYVNHTWNTVPEVSMSDPSAELDVADQIRNELAKGDLHVLGTSPLDGKQTVELSGTFPLPVPLGIAWFWTATGLNFGGAKGLSPAAMIQPAYITLFTIWVDPTTYLPLQQTLSLSNGGANTSTYQWLSPDASNLALLKAPIPAGFSQSSATPGESSATAQG